MISDSNIKAKIKKALLITNITLGVIFASLLAVWLLALRPTQFEIATKMDQYAYFNLDNLPKIANKIEADYIGYQDPAITAYGEGDDSETDNADYIGEKIAAIEPNEETIDTELSDIENAMPEGLLDKAEEIAQKSSKILSRQNVTTKQKGEAEASEASADKLIVKYSGNAKIAIIVTNLGLNRKSTELALTLPKQCALGFLPYTKSLKPLLHKAQSDGHEIYLYLPLQTSRSYDNPGKYALMGNLPAEENMMRLNVVLNSHARYDGVYSSFKEVFTTNPRVSEAMFDHLEDKNLIFLMGRPQLGSAVSHIEKRKKIIFTNVIIDKEPEESEIQAGLEKLIKEARENGSALGYAQGYPLTIEMISAWIPKLRERGVKLVPVSDLLK